MYWKIVKIREYNLSIKKENKNWNSFKLLIFNTLQFHFNNMSFLFSKQEESRHLWLKKKKNSWSLIYDCFWLIKVLFKLMMSFTSTDINECENHNPCKNLGQKCINGPGNFTCSCIKGYHKDESAGTCVTNQSSRPVTYTLLVGKYTYYTAP